MIQLQGITKKYGSGNNEFLALKGIDLDITPGEFIAIMGPSGSGKSTLMNILGALDKPTSGTYQLRDQKVSKLSDMELAKFRNQEVGFVFQQFNLLKKTNVYDNVALPGLYGALPDLDSRVKKVLASVGLEDKLDNLPTQLSGGQIQRVAIARALLMQPAILLADEPTGNLDSKTGAQIMELFVELHSQGNTIVMVTHEEEVAAYAERIIRVLDGNIQADEKNQPDYSYATDDPQTNAVEQPAQNIDHHAREIKKIAATSKLSSDETKSSPSFWSDIGTTIQRLLAKLRPNFTRSKNTDD